MKTESPETKPATAEAPDELVLVLRKPISIKDGDSTVDYAQLDLREPTVDELEELTKLMKKSSTEVAAMKTFIALIAGVPPLVIGKMGARDFNKANDYFGSFLSAAD